MDIKNTTFRRLAVLLGVLVFVLACPRHRPLRIVVNQGEYGIHANYSELYYSDFFDGVMQMADDFVLTEDNNTITNVRWWGVYRDNIPAEDEFTIFIYEIDDPGVPRTHPWYEDTSSEVSRTATASTMSWAFEILTIYEYNLDITDVELEPDRDYALSIVNNCGRWAWVFNGSLTQGNNYGWSRDERFGDWSEYDHDCAFVLWSNR